MKYIVLQGDGMADWPVAELGNKTPLEYARTPNMDRIAAQGILGLTHTIPDGFPSGSDVGTMSLLGYDPRRYHTGRSPIEAASMGVELSPDDIAFRCNLVTVGPGESGQEIMVDFAADHITSEEAAELIKTINVELGGKEIEFYPGVSYRHLMVWHGGKEKMQTTPPHDITGQSTAGHFPEGDGAERLQKLMEQSRAILASHPVNKKRQDSGHMPASSIWLWGQGRRPAVPTIKQQFGLDGSVISAVDLVRGIGVLAGLEVINVPGATGFLDTNYLGKGQYGLESLRHKDFLFLHVEATDEAGHMGSAEKKVQALQDFDEKVVGTILDGLHEFPEWRILLMPDHATPVAIKTHSSDPVPFAILTSDDAKQQNSKPIRYNESCAKATGLVVPEAWTIMQQFIRGEALIP